MERLTKHSRDDAYCNVGYCPEDCNTCRMFIDIRKKLAYYEDLEEQGRLIIIDEDQICDYCDYSWAYADGSGSCKDTCERYKNRDKRLRG